MPKQSKAILRSQLDDLGFNDMRLFASLEALSKWIVYGHRIVAYGAPPPPPCSGPVPAPAKEGAGS